MKDKLKETIADIFAKLIEVSLRSTTFTATTDANGYVHLPASLNGAIPVWAEVSGNLGRPCFLRNSLADTAKFGVRFKSWDDAVLNKNTTITVTVYYLWGGTP